MKPTKDVVLSCLGFMHIDIVTGLKDIRDKDGGSHAWSDCSRLFKSMKDFIVQCAPSHIVKPVNMTQMNKVYWDGTEIEYGLTFIERPLQEDADNNVILMGITFLIKGKKYHMVIFYSESELNTEGASTYCTKASGKLEVVTL